MPAVFPVAYPRPGGRRPPLFLSWVVALSFINPVALSHAQQENAGNPPASNASNPAAPPPIPPSEEPGETFNNSPFGDLGGLRGPLLRRGIRVGGTYIGEVQGNVRGGRRRGAIAEGLFEGDLDVDLKRLAGLAGGTAHLAFFWSHGPGLSDRYVGDLSNVSNIAAYDTVRLAEAWVQQNFFGARLSLKVGQLLSENDFYFNEYGTVFLASPFGTPPFLAGNFPGFPNYPLPAPGVRVLFRLTPAIELRTAVYAGTTLSESDNPHSRPVIRGRDGVISFYEAAYRRNQEEKAAGLPGTFKLGAVFHSRFRGALNANPASANRPLTALYLAADQAVWRGASSAPGGKEEAQPTLAVFARFGYVPGSAAFISHFAEGGLNFKGPFPGREQDVFGLGVVHYGVGDRAGRGIQRVDGGARLRSETLVEATYAAKLTPWLTLQPDFQYLLNPGGTSAARDAVVLGLRSTLTF